MAKYDNLVFIDVEATDISPFSGRMTEFGAVHFTSRETFHGVLWTNCTPDPKNPAKPVIDPVHSKKTSHMRLALEFGHWLKENVKGRVTMVSDNPAYDFMWMAYFFDSQLQWNPLGHSARRISDFYAGLRGDWSQTQTWKQYRKTKHDHNPVNDAMGNVEAFAHILWGEPE
jgi:hypothetical protein